MKESRWFRPLDEIELVKDKWLMYNPLYGAYKGLFDQGFEQGFSINVDHYVLRENQDGVSWEEESCQFLFSSQNNPTGKVFVLEGSVGSGKTSFVQFMCQRLLPRTFKNPVCIHVDTWKLFDGATSDVSHLEKAFCIAAEEAIVPHLFTRKAFISGVLRNMGFTPGNEREILELGSLLRPKDIIRFILNTPSITHLLIVIDNIDDNPAQVVKAGGRFIWELAHFIRGIREKIPTTLMITAREYTANYFSDTVKFAVRYLPPIDIIKVIEKKLEQTKELVREETKPINHTVTWFAYSEEEKSVVPQSRIYTITAENTYIFLQYVAKYILSAREPKLLALIRSLSDGNLKIVVRNVYNIFHSVKLPLYPVFDRVFSPVPNYPGEHESILFPPNIGCECLMAIHYPFYDVKNSNIINVFNATSSKTPHDYQNALVIVRILCFLLNIGKPVTYGKIIQEFIAAGYDPSYLSAGLEKCIHYGIVRSSHGVSIADFDPMSTEIRTSTAAKVYIEQLMWEPSYLQYVCEDTPMPKELCVSISEKYRSSTSYGSKVKRMEGVEKLIKYVELQEQEEKSRIKELGRDEKAFLSLMSVHRHKGGCWIHKTLKDEVLPRIRSSFDSKE